MKADIMWSRGKAWTWLALRFYAMRWMRACDHCIARAKAAATMEKVTPQQINEQSAIACQIMARTAYHMSTMNGHVKDKDRASTIFWQERAAHWSLMDRMLRGLPH